MSEVIAKDDRHKFRLLAKYRKLVEKKIFTQRRRASWDW
jgi:hypothetical protein